MAAMSINEKKILIEQIGDDFGVTVRYEIGEYGKTCVDFFAAEVIAAADDGSRYYSRKGAVSSTDDTDDFNEAERLVSGSVKWDGCSHYYFGYEDGYLHMHGAADLEKLSQALVTIYERCGELMKEHGGNLLEGEFKVT
jgi:hypothetical protein